MSTRTVQDALDQYYSISITYVPTSKTISFSGYVDSFSDSFKQEWNSESVYGRQDPIYTYKSTTRNISIKIDVPSDSQPEAEANFKKLQQLISFAYPVYVKEAISYLGVGELDASISNTVTSADKLAGGNAMLLAKPPLVAIKYANLISSTTYGGKLLGKLSDIKYEMDKESGFYSKNGNLIPKYFGLQLELDVIHTEALGWEVNGSQTTRRTTSKFPYGV